MCLTRKVDYGLRVVLELSKEPEGTLVPARELARRQGIPLPFLSKVIADLASARILETKRGVNGGIRLCVSPESISVLDVLEAVDGFPGLCYCAGHEVECHRKPYCGIRATMLAIEEKLRSELKAISVAAMLELERETQQMAQVQQDS